MNTDELIDSLATRLAPVSPLPHPALRAALWLTGAVLYVGILSLTMAKAAGASVSTPALLASQIAALATCVLAAVAAFASVVPGYSSRIFAWPATAAIVWLGTLVLGAPQHDDAVTIIEARHEWICVGLIVLGGAPMLGALALMLRRGAPLHPASTAALGAITTWCSCGMAERSLC
jgi:hypothetical protein